MSGLPEAVQKQGDAADTLQKQVMEGTLVNVEGVSAPSSDPAPAAPVTDNINQPATPAPGSDDGTYQHRFEVLQGKYNAELPRANEEIRRLRTELEGKNETIRNLSAVINSRQDNAAPAAPATSPGFHTQPGQSPISALNPQDFEGYGEEMIKLVNGFNALLQENRELKGQVNVVGKEVARSAEDKYFDALVKLVPDWESINDNQNVGWHEWLKSKDPMTGIVRQSYLNDARAKLDVERTANIFNTYKAVRGTAQQAPPATPATTQGGRVNPLASQVLPDETIARKPVDPALGSLSKADVSKAAQDFVKGLITEQEFNAISNTFQKQLKGG